MSDTREYLRPVRDFLSPVAVTAPSHPRARRQISTPPRLTWRLQRSAVVLKIARDRTTSADAKWFVARAPSPPVDGATVRRSLCGHDVNASSRPAAPLVLHRPRRQCNTDRRYRLTSVRAAVCRSRDRTIIIIIIIIVVRSGVEVRFRARQSFGVFVFVNCFCKHC